MEGEFCDGDLQPNDDGKMDEIHPIGGVREVANHLVWLVAEQAKNPDGEPD